MTDPLELKFHRIVCPCGHVTYSGDKDHHVTKEVLCPRTCQKCGSDTFKIYCPPECHMLTHARRWPPTEPRTAWARILEDD